MSSFHREFEDVKPIEYKAGKERKVLYPCVYVVFTHGKCSSEISQLKLLEANIDAESGRVHSNSWKELNKSESIAPTDSPSFEKIFQIVAYPKAYLTQKLRIDFCNGNCVVGSAFTSVLELFKRLQQSLPITFNGNNIGEIQLSSNIDTYQELITSGSAGQITSRDREDIDGDTSEQMDIVHEGEVNLASNTSRILLGLSQKFYLETSIIDTIKNILHAEALKIVHECTAYLSKGGTVQVYAGGGVRPPYGDHPACNRAREAAFPLAQEMLLPKAVIQESCCTFEACRVLCGQDLSDEELLFTYGSDDEDDEDEEREQPRPHRDDILTPPALPDVLAVDPDGRLRTNLLRSAPSSWGGRTYAIKACYRNVVQLRTGLVEAAALYQPDLAGQAPVDTRSSATGSKKLAVRRRASYQDVRVGYVEAFDSRFLNMVRADEGAGERYNMDVEALSQLLLTPCPKRVKLVTWILGRNPPAHIMSRARDLLRFMAEKRGGRVGLLVVLASESGLHKSTAESVEEAMPFKHFSAMVRSVMRAPNRPTVAEEEDRKRELVMPASSRIRRWKQQVVEAEVSGTTIEYEATVSSPKLLVVHLLSWIEVMDRAILEECEVGLNTGSVYPKTSSIIKQFAPLFPKKHLQTIRGNLSKEQRPDQVELRAMQLRFENVIRDQIADRVQAYVLDLFSSGLSMSKN